VTAVPNASVFLDGVVFSRGEVVPALNLRARFGFERAPYDLSTRLLVVHAAGRTVGLVVDAAREFVSIDPAAILPPAAALTGLSGRYLEGVANIGNRLILVLNLGEVLTFSDPVLEHA
jgi:chemotaxis signal transduction protein